VSDWRTTTKRRVNQRKKSCFLPKLSAKTAGFIDSLTKNTKKRGQISTFYSSKALLPVVDCLAKMHTAQKFPRPVLHNYLIIVPFAAEDLSKVCVFRGSMAPVEQYHQGVAR
jgi:hypothetical protein